MPLPTDAQVDSRSPASGADLRSLLENDAAEAVETAEVDATDEDERRYRPRMRPFLDDAHFAQLPAEEGVDLPAGVLEEVMKIEAEAAQRAAPKGEELGASALAILHFGKPERA
jgi:hypothetical protein